MGIPKLGQKRDTSSYFFLRVKGYSRKTGYDTRKNKEFTFLTKEFLSITFGIHALILIKDECFFLRKVFEDCFHLFFISIPSLQIRNNNSNHDCAEKATRNNCITMIAIIIPSLRSKVKRAIIV